jgi:2-polyprenyl-3-methyl-5-hydroxy-6-metoxy-1,4-benzoquinol methylase
MDRVGTWLSAAKIARVLGPLKGKDVGDFGCGHRGWLTQNLLAQVKSATLVDVSLDQALKKLPNVRAIEGILPEVLAQVATESLDAVVCNNVVEHVWNRRALIEQVRRVLRPGGRAFINVPSWRGQWLLETAAFRWGLTSRSEIDDHKAYFDRRELWLLLVEGGFRPSEIRCTTHKFRLNTCAVCTIGSKRQ